MRAVVAPFRIDLVGFAILIVGRHCETKQAFVSAFSLSLFSLPSLILQSTPPLSHTPIPTSPPPLPSLPLLSVSSSLRHSSNVQARQHHAALAMGACPTHKQKRPSSKHTPWRGNDCPPHPPCTCSPVTHPPPPTPDCTTPCMRAHRAATCSRI